MTNFRKLQNEELNRISTEAFKKAPKLPVVILLDHVRSQNNVGSVFRTSDAFRIEKIFLCGITSTPENREVHKVIGFLPSNKPKIPLRWKTFLCHPVRNMR